MRNRKGISIIVLVITIVVLLILASTTMYITDHYDIYNETKNTTDDLKREQVVSAIKLEIRQYRLDKQLEDEYEISIEEINNIVKKYGVIQNVDGQNYLVNEEQGYSIKLIDIDPIFQNN